MKMARLTSGPVALLSLLTLFSGVPAHAAAEQASATPLTSEDLKAPPAPALVVLGVAPTAIERPQGVRPLVMSLVAASKDTGFPNNYAAEFAPYWLGTPKLSFDDYYADTPKNLFRQLSISVATTPLTAASGKGTAVGFGVRTVPLPGRPHPQLREKRQALAQNDAKLLGETKLMADTPRAVALLRLADSAAGRAIAARLSDAEFKAILDEDKNVVNDIEKARTELVVLGREPESADRQKKISEANARLKDALDRRAALGTRVFTLLGQSGAVDDLARQQLIQTILSRVDSAETTTIEKLDAAGKALALEIQELDRQRVGVLLSVATALSWQIPGDDTSQLARSRTSVWLTPGYRFLACATKKNDEVACTSSIDLLAVARYTSDPGVDSFWDMGARLVWQPVKPVALSFEALGRSGSSDDSGSRLVGVAEYQFNGTAFLYASFGRDFTEKNVRHNLVSIFGLTLGFGKKPIVTAPPLPK